MNYQNSTKYKNFFFKFFFILNALIYLVKIEGDLSVPADYCYNPIQIRIEQVVSERPEYNLRLSQFDTSQKQIADFTLANIDFSFINKYSLIQFNNYVFHELKSYQHPFSPNHQLTSILQKHNIWHQSSDESDPLFG